MEEYSVDITALVRSIQRADNQKDCFRSGKTLCDDGDCIWRPYCFATVEIPGDKKRDRPDARWRKDR